MSYCSVGGMRIASYLYVTVRTFCQPSDCCGPGPNIAGIGHDVSDNYSIGIDVSLILCISMYVLG